MSERVDEYHDYRLRVKACHACGEDVVHKGHIKSVPGYFHPNRVDVLVVVYQPEEIDHTRTKVNILTGPKGDVIRAAMIREHMKGDPRVGYTSLVKCKLANGRVKRRVCKECMKRFYDYEIAFLKPKVIVLTGEDVIKAVLPELLSADKYNNIWSLEGRPFLHFDQWYVFMRDPADALSSKDFKPESNLGYQFAIGMALREAVDL